MSHPLDCHYCLNTALQTQQCSKVEYRVLCWNYSSCCQYGSVSLLISFGTCMQKLKARREAQKRQDQSCLSRTQSVPVTSSRTFPASPHHTLHALPAPVTPSASRFSCSGTHFKTALACMSRRVLPHVHAQTCHVSYTTQAFTMISLLLGTSPCSIAESSSNLLTATSGLPSYIQVEMQVQSDCNTWQQLCHNVTLVLLQRTQVLRLRGTWGIASHQVLPGVQSTGAFSALRLPP